MKKLLLIGICLIALSGIASAKDVLGSPSSGINSFFDDDEDAPALLRPEEGGAPVVLDPTEGEAPAV